MSVIHSVHFVLTTINSRQRAIDATQPSNDGQAQGNVWFTFWEHLLKFFYYGGPFEDKVGFGKPSENPYVTDCLSTYVVCMIENGTSTRSHPAPLVCS
jgi:hypothetical protein